MFFTVTVWTDFGVPSTSTYAELNAPHKHGIDAINDLGCTRYTIKTTCPGGWRTLFDSAEYMAQIEAARR